METKLGFKRGTKIEFFDRANEVNENDIYIVRKDSIEGHDKAVLEPVRRIPVKPYEMKSDIVTIVQNHYDEMPEQLLSGIHALVFNWFEKKLQEESS